MRKRTIFAPCERHAPMYARVTRRRAAEVFIEGGWAASPCQGGHCTMRPGRDFYNAAFVAANPTYTVENDS